MSKLLVLANEATAAQRRVYFHLVDATDGLTPETGEAGGQPQVSSDGGAWTNTGVSTLSAIGNGRYYADLTQTLVQTAGTQIETRYKSANTAECPGDSVQVVAFDPNDSAALGLTLVPSNVTQISGDATAADNAEAFFDGTGYAGTNNVIPTVTTVTSLTNERGKYALGSVWIGPSANTNTTSYTDGIITNPVSTIDAAKTIADALGMRRFEIIRTGTVQISASLAGYRLGGVGWSCTTTGGSQDVGTSAFLGGNITGGTFASTSGTINWQDCEFADGVTIGVSNLVGCRFAGGTTLSTAGNYDFVDCASIVAGTSAPTFTVPAGTVNVSFRRWSGGITISGITSTTTISIDAVSGGTVTLNGADGNVQVRGMIATLTDNRTGSPTLGQNAVINRTTIATPTNITAGTITTVSGNVSGSVGSVTGAVGSVTGNVGGNVTGSVGSVLGGINTTGGTITTLDALDTAQDTQHSTTQTAVADVPTNAELATALAAADDAVLAAIAALNNLSSAQAQTAATAALTTALTEGYRSTGATGSARDLLYEIIAHLGESSISGTTKTLKKLDASTTAKTYTLDSATTPTSITETT